jgi:hypothetical protein
MESGSAAGAADFVEHGFKATTTGSFVAELGAEVVSTFQSAATDLEADVLGLEVLINWPSAMLAFSRLPFTGFPLSRATTLATLVSSTIESRSIDSSTARRLFHSLVANRVRCRPSTAACNLDLLKTRSAFAIMTHLLAEMATG